MFLTLVSAALNFSQAWDICTIFSFIWKAVLNFFSVILFVNLPGFIWRYKCTFFEMTFQRFFDTFGRRTRCLKITKKVSFNIASEASYVYIWSGQKFPKRPKYWNWWKMPNATFLVIFKHCVVFRTFLQTTFFFLKLTQLPKLLSNFFRMESSWSLHFVQKESVGNQNSSEIESGRTSENENGLPQVSTKITQGEGIKSGHQRKNGFISKKIQFSHQNLEW